MIGEFVVDVLARTLWGEARGETFDGQVAVAWTIRNRADKPGPDWWGDSVTEVCLKARQYSAWNPNDPNRPKLEAASVADPAFLRARGIAHLVLSGDLKDPTAGCTHYHTDDVRPPWAAGKPPALRIGRHLFYRGIK